MKKAGTLKRILSILMAVFIVFGFAPDSVFAAPQNGVVKDDGKCRQYVSGYYGIVSLF